MQAPLQTGQGGGGVEVGRGGHKNGVEGLGLGRQEGFQVGVAAPDPELCGGAVPGLCHRVAEGCQLQILEALEDAHVLPALGAGADDP